VELAFESGSLQRICSSRAALDGRWGADGGRAVAQALTELRAMSEIGDLESFPHVRLSEDGEGAVVIRSSTGLTMHLRVPLTAGDGASVSAWRSAREAVIHRVFIEDRVLADDGDE
jgi:hypothetical protein